MNPGFEKAIHIFSANGGILRTSQSVKQGIAPRTLYKMRDAGLLRQISRGVYQLTSNPLPGQLDMISVIMRVPKAVICLISALHFYGLTTQIPHRVSIALPQSAEKPRLDYPPADIVWLTEKSYSAGVTEQLLDGFSVKIYSKEKTIADCFKFRNKIGLDIALEALKAYLNLADRQIDQLLIYARVDRVENLLQRYIEALI